MGHMSVSTQSSLFDVAVIGTGSMGTGIAQVAAQAGHPVHLVDSVAGAAEAARDRLATTLGHLASRGKITLADADATIANLQISTGLAQLPPCGIILEAIREDLGDKCQLFGELAEHQPASTILASNTSSLDLTQMAEAIPDPERVIGLHFFNPPPLMRLVEVIRGDQHDNEGARGPLDAATALMRAWGKTPVQCTSTPGFIVNRIARPFYGEAQRMVAAGVADAATIDYALREHGGFRMGPMELTDLIGQDVNLAVGTSVWEQTGRDPRYAPTDYQRELVAAGHLGRKSGQGIFTYDESHHPLDVTPDVERAAALTASDAPVTTNPVARTVAMLVNEAVDLVARGEASPDDVDTAMQLGTNYPKGPIAWGAEIGLDVIADRLRQLDAAFPGGRYRVSPALLEASRR